jgi:hypothetical protein
VTPAVLACFLVGQASASVPATALSSLYGIGAATAAASVQAAYLAQGTLHAMFWAKIKLCAAVVAVASVATAGVAIPLVASSSPAARVEPARQVLLRLDFEDGKLPPFCRLGRVVKGPERPGNRFCLEGQPPPGATNRMFLEKEEGLFNYSDDLALVFDIWVDAQVATVDFNMWDRTQQAAYGAEPLRLPREQWVERVVVRFADFRYGPDKVRPRSGDSIVNLSIQAGQLGGAIYVDNLEIVRAADLPSSLGQTKK